MRWFLFILPLFLLAACLQTAKQEASPLPPVASGNVAQVPEDEGPVGKSKNGTYQTIIPLQTPEPIVYSGSSN